jgi:hypothetical protein
MKHDVQLTKDFRLSHFNCPDNCLFPGVFFRNIELLAHQIQILQDHLQEPIEILEAYKCIAQNTREKGTFESQHIIGKAIIFQVDRVETMQVMNIIDDLITTNFIKQGVVMIWDKKVYYDISGQNYRWDLR